MQHRLTSFGLALAFVALLGGGASAKHCRDAHGKFTKCSAASSMMARPKKCRDAKGKFVKCPMMK